jgi:hypothetical protein
MERGPGLNVQRRLVLLEDSGLKQLSPVLKFVPAPTLLLYQLTLYPWVGLGASGLWISKETSCPVVELWLPLPSVFHTGSFGIAIPNVEFATFPLPARAREHCRICPILGACPVQQEAAWWSGNPTG